MNKFKKNNINKKISLFIFIALITTNFVIPFKIISSGFQKNIASAEGCSILSAVWTPSGEQEDDFYIGGSTTANIFVKSKNCVDKTGVNLTIKESDRFPLINTDDSWNDSKLDRREISIPSDNFTIKIKLGEEDCESGLTGAVGYDCDLFFYIRQTDTIIYNSWNQNKGNLYYECDRVCWDNGGFMGVIGNSTDTKPINIDGIVAINIPDTYTLLAPIGDLKEAPKNIGDYFNTIFKIAIGLCGALAVIMIVIGGVQYMGNESIFGQTEAKSKITAAILGLIIVLGSYALLNTLNPALLGKDGVSIKQVTAEIIDLPDAGDGTVDPDFKKGKGSYSSDATVSSGVTTAVNKLKQGWEIDQFRVYTNNRMVISLKKGAEIDNTNIIDIRPGINGYAENGTAKVGDKKTPLGSWKILNIKTSPEGQPVYNKSGANMGATFWLLSPMSSGERGIGMHGNKNGTLSETYGCIRLKNADLLALLPYVKSGIDVYVGN